MTNLKREIFEKCRNTRVLNVSVVRAQSFVPDNKHEIRKRKQNENDTTTNEKPSDADS